MSNIIGKWTTFPPDNFNKVKFHDHLTSINSLIIVSVCIFLNIFYLVFNRLIVVLKIQMTNNQC